MNKTKTQAPWAQWLAQVGPRFLPFADAASEDLPLSRLLRLSLFQISVGMAMVMLVGTLNRVMIVEMQVPATLVSFMVALPLLIAPLRAMIGFRSDNHRSQLGWRRVPYIWMGTLLQFGGFSIMPFALLVLSGAGQAHQAPAWVGLIGAAGAFLLVGLGMHTVQTAGLALATDLAPPESQPQVVGLMYVMQLLGMIASALILGHLLSDYSPGQLIRVVQAVAVVTLVLNVVALWKQEARSRLRKPGTPMEHSFVQAWQLFCDGPPYSAPLARGRLGHHGVHHGRRVARALWRRNFATQCVHHHLADRDAGGGWFDGICLGLTRPQPGDRRLPHGRLGGMGGRAGVYLCHRVGPIGLIAGVCAGCFSDRFGWRFVCPRDFDGHHAAGPT